MTRPVEETMMRRARIRMGLLAGLAVGAALAVVGVISYVVLVDSQEKQIAHELAWGADHGTVTGPAGCNWIIELAAGRLTVGPAAAPPGFPRRAELDRVAAGGAAETTEVRANGTVYHVLTRSTGTRVVQVVFDARYQLADRQHLRWAFTLAAMAGLLAALATGLTVGHRAVAPLAEALTRQRRFVADASHELRTPIAQVHTRAQVLARRARAGNPADLPDLERLVDTTRRLGEIVDELLLSARLAVTPAGRVPVDLTAVAEAAVATEGDRATERGVTVRLRTPGHPVPVPGIDSALRRVVSELLANALTHTPSGGAITMTVRSTTGHAEVVVADTGDGFDPADARRIFDRFHRGAGAGDRRFGLGLALLQEVVTGHGGTIAADGHPGHGAVFTVRLPATAP